MKTYKALFVFRYYLKNQSDKENIKSKFDYQIEAIRALGFKTIYFAISDGKVFRIDDSYSRYIASFRFSKTPIVSKFSAHIAIYRQCIKEIKNEKFDFVYIRSTPVVLEYYRAIKAFKKYCKNIVVEVPTFPIEKEIINEKRFWIKYTYNYMKYIEKKASKYVSLYALIGEKSNKYFSRPAINIINGTSVKNFCKHNNESNEENIHIIALAGMANYHGFDRLIKGLSEYLHDDNKIPVYIHLVGSDVDGSLKSWKKLTESLSLNEYVIFEGQKTGKELDNIFNQCNIASSSLAGFRIGLHIGLNLKAAEYFSRGIPFICCPLNIDSLANLPYIYDKIPENETPVDISEVVRFAMTCKRNRNTSIEMRDMAKNISWIKQFEKILKELDLI